MNEKFFKSVARLQKRAAKLYKQGFIRIEGIEPTVQVTCELFAKLAPEGPEIFREFSEKYPGEFYIGITIVGLEYFTIGTLAEFAEAGIIMPEQVQS